MRISEYPVGTRVTLRFSFVNRKLTRTEREAYEETGALPAGVAYEVDQAFLDYRDPDTAIKTTLEGEQIAHEGFGKYSAKVIISKPGRWRWQGRGIVSGTPVAATPVRAILGTAL